MLSPLAKHLDSSGRACTGAEMLPFVQHDTGVAQEKWTGGLSRYRMSNLLIVSA